MAAGALQLLLEIVRRVAPIIALNQQAVLVIVLDGGLLASVELKCATPACPVVLKDRLVVLGALRCWVEGIERLELLPARLDTGLLFVMVDAPLPGLTWRCCVHYLVGGHFRRIVLVLLRSFQFTAPGVFGDLLRSTLILLWLARALGDGGSADPVRRESKVVWLILLLKELGSGSRYLKVLELGELLNRLL